MLWETGGKVLVSATASSVSSLGKYSFSFSIGIFPLGDVSTSSFCLHHPNYFEHSCKNRGKETFQVHVVTEAVSLHKVT